MVYALAGIVAFIAISLWNFWMAVRPTKFDIKGDPSYYNLPYEPIALLTKDGVKIAGWFIPAEQLDAPAIILIHGYPAEKSDLLFLADALHDSFSIFMFDLRYFGDSGGTFTTLGIDERLDLLAAIDFLNNRGYERIGVFGFSLGGAIAIMHAATDNRILAVVSYASFANLKTLGREIYRRLFLLKYPLVELMSVWTRLFLGYDVERDSPERAAKILETPLLLIHSKTDGQISFRHAELLQKALANDDRAEFYFLENAMHGEFPPELIGRIRNFFLQHLKLI